MGGRCIGDVGVGMGVARAGAPSHGCVRVW